MLGLLAACDPAARHDFSVRVIGRRVLDQRRDEQLTVHHDAEHGFLPGTILSRAYSPRMPLPQGIELVWGGQFQNFNRAKTRLSLLVPVALAIIAVLLVMTFRSMRYMVVTVLNLPFAVAGHIERAFLDFV